MQIALDIGNTLAKAYFFYQEKLQKKEQIESNYISAKWIKSIISNEDQLIISSVITLPDEINEMIQKDSRFSYFEIDNNLPLKLNYLTPNTLGHDRLLACIGAWSRFPNNNVLVIDVGSCITCDLVTADGTYQGGSISPGLHMRLRSLNEFTSKLPKVDIDKNIERIGKSTVDSISSGVFYGILGELSENIKVYKLKFQNLRLFITGGDKNLFAKHLNFDIFADPNLVAKGLLEVLKIYNAKA